MERTCGRMLSQGVSKVHVREKLHCYVSVHVAKEPHIFGLMRLRLSFVAQVF